VHSHFDNVYNSEITDIILLLTFSGLPFKFLTSSSHEPLNFLNGLKMHCFIEQTILIAFFKLGTTNKNQFTYNGSIYVYLKYHSNQSLFT